jgi:hypothetical protein
MKIEKFKKLQKRVRTMEERIELLENSCYAQPKIMKELTRVMVQFQKKKKDKK